jgi:hypothetical protein
MWNSSLVAMLMATLMLLGMAGSASASHNGNNKATIEGESGVSGRAVVNYSKGTGTFGGTIGVTGLEPGETYTFRVIHSNGSLEKDVCQGEANSQGKFSCSFQGMALDGFTDAQVVDEEGNVLGSGMFDRAGNCRDKAQPGSQCKAGQHHD